MPSQNRRHPYAAAIITCAVVACAHLAARQTPRPQAPTFRGNAELVLVDFFAVEKDGWPVPDLDATELTLKVDGKFRGIRSLQFIRLAEAASIPTDNPGLTPPKPEAPPAIGDPLADLGRTVVIVVGRISPGGERPSIAAAQRFLDSLTPRDQIALVSVPMPSRADVGLTTGRARIRAALATIITDKISDATPTTIPMVDAVIEMLRTLGPIAGPKIIVFISESFNHVGTELRDLARVAGEVRAHFYVIQPLRLSGGASTMSSAGGGYARVSPNLQDLAGATGGQLFFPSGTPHSVFTRIARESSAYYLLGFEPEASERDGKRHTISLDVVRDRVQIQARPAFTIGRR